MQLCCAPKEFYCEVSGNIIVTYTVVQAYYNIQLLGAAYKLYRTRKNVLILPGQCPYITLTFLLQVMMYKTQRSTMHENTIICKNHLKMAD